MSFGVIVHYPGEQKAQQELEKKVAEVHAQTVIELVKSMPFPAGRKVRLICAIKSNISK